MKQLIILGLIFISHIGFSQLRETSPASSGSLDLSAEGEKAFKANLAACQAIWDKMARGTEYDDLSKQEQEALTKVDETMEDYWDIIGGGCNWYCGGGPKEVTASSYLKSQGTTNYAPQNAHDLNYKNAWVEGVAGYGIGEYLLYSFDASSPRITEINVVNGYVKSQSAWENNSRVKKLKVYIDDEPFVILNLQDIRGVQCFKFEPIGKGWEVAKEQPDWTMKFEILDVYKGLKYDDVVISEIYFDGIDVHCFAKGTQVLMSDNSTKVIEDLKVGDFVSYLDFETNVLKPAEIIKLEKVMHHGLVTYKFESGREITTTPDHPFSIQGKGWASLKPDQSGQYKGFENVDKISVGDVFVTANGTDKLMAIVYLEGGQETYTISKLSTGDNFIANGLVVGVEELTQR